MADKPRKGIPFLPTDPTLYATAPSASPAFRTDPPVPLSPFTKNKSGEGRESGNEGIVPCSTDEASLAPDDLVDASLDDGDGLPPEDDAEPNYDPEEALDRDPEELDSEPDYEPDYDSPAVARDDDPATGFDYNDDPAALEPSPQTGPAAVQAELEYDPARYCDNLIECGRVYEWLEQGASSKRECPTYTLDELLADGSTDLGLARIVRGTDGTSRLQIAPDGTAVEHTAQLPEDPSNGPLARRLIHFLNNEVDRAVMTTYTGTPAYWSTLFNSDTLIQFTSQRLTSPGCAKIHLMIPGTKAQELVPILIAGDQRHHSRLLQIAGGKYPDDYDASPFFTFTIYERPPNGNTTDHSKLGMFSHRDWRSVFIVESSANLSSPGHGYEGIDKPSALTDNFSFETSLRLHVPLGHSAIKRASDIISRAVVLKRQSGHIRPHERLSWATEPKPADRERLRRERRMAALTDEKIKNLVVEPAPYVSAYALPVPSLAQRNAAKGKRRVNPSTTALRALRQTVLPSDGEPVHLTCDGCLASGIFTSTSKLETTYYHSRLLGAVKTKICPAKLRPITRGLVFDPRPHGGYEGDSGSGTRLNLVLTTSAQQAYNTVLEVVKGTAVKSTSDETGETITSYNGLHGWYVGIPSDLVGGEAIDSSLLAHFSALPELHPQRAYYLKLLEQKGAVRQHLWNLLGSDIYYAGIRTDDETPRVLAKQFNALIQFMAHQQGYLREGDPFDPVLDTEVRARLKVPPPTNEEQRRIRDARFAARAPGKQQAANQRREDSRRLDAAAPLEADKDESSAYGTANAGSRPTTFTAPTSTANATGSNSAVLPASSGPPSILQHPTDAPFAGLSSTNIRRRPKRKADGDPIALWDDTGGPRSKKPRSSKGSAVSQANDTSPSRAKKIKPVGQGGTVPRRARKARSARAPRKTYVYTSDQVKSVMVRLILLDTHVKDFDDIVRRFEPFLQEQTPVQGRVFSKMLEQVYYDVNNIQGIFAAYLANPRSSTKLSDRVYLFARLLALHRGGSGAYTS